jgi:hypothetical protein
MIVSWDTAEAAPADLAPLAIRVPRAMMPPARIVIETRISIRVKPAVGRALGVRVIMMEASLDACFMG